ncbi:hypothetical protein ADQ66_23795, partial [Salmonella enterica]|nr:hypothetical protein [Salmonella enterica]
GGQDARHKLPGIRQVKKPVLTDGLFCVCGNCKTVGLISAAPSGGVGCLMVLRLSGLRHRHNACVHRLIPST